MDNTVSLHTLTPKCTVCSELWTFKCQKDFSKHLRDFHCTKEGGSFICRYGAHGLCSSLPVEGVSDKDYEDHVTRDHLCVHGSKLVNPSLLISMIPQSEPNIVADQHKWTVYCSKQNLSAVLNDPRKSRRETDFFTKTWGESFLEKTEISPHPSLPEINRSHFDSYLKDMGKRFKRKIKNSDIRPPNFHNAKREFDDIFPVLHITRNLEKQPSDLDQVPKIFLQSNFSLENPEIFHTVFGRSQFEAMQPGNANHHQSSKLLQEKLSHYLDIVEVQIAEQISLQSEAFFHAMTSHDKLQEHLSETCQAIKHLRAKVNHLDEMLVKGSLQILKYKCSYDNALSLFKKLKMMATVHQTQPTIQLLLSTSEFVGALDLISTTQEVLTQELAGIHSFRHLGSQLIEMEKLIDKMMYADFIRYATSALNRPLLEPELVMEEERLVAIVFGMLRQHKFIFVDVFKEESLTAVKAILKQTVVEIISQADDIDMDTQAGSLSDQMRSLSFPKWLDLLSKVFDSLMIVIHRVKAVYNIMSDAVNIAAGKAHSPLSPARTLNSTPEVTFMQVSVSSELDLMIAESEYHKLVSTLKEMICAVCDHTHDRTAKLLSVRARDGCLDKLSSSEFVNLSRQVESFTSRCETVCGRKSSSLCAVLQTQANRFVNKFHEERKTKLSLILDNERWKQADVPPEFQDLVDNISRTGKLVIPPNIISEIERKSQEYLLVDGEKFAVVGTVLMLLKIVVEYAACIDDIPSITADILIRLIDVLKIFNSRTCQLILGAGALQLVGLKTITTKNLALASRCLQLMVHYIPIAKLHFEARLSYKQHTMLKYFDQVLKDYQDHVEEILKKLISIMESMFSQQLAKYEVKAPVPSNCFRSICKQMVKLHEAIADLLPQHQIMCLFIQVNSALKKRMRLQLVKLNVNNDGGPQHGLVTSELVFYMGHLKSLNGMSDFQDKMDDIWEKKHKTDETLSGYQNNWPS